MAGLLTSVAFNAEKLFPSFVRENYPLFRQPLGLLLKINLVRICAPLAVLVVVVLVIVWLERRLAFTPSFAPSPLWADVADIPLEKMGNAVSGRRRDEGFEVGDGNEACVIWNGGGGGSSSGGTRSSPRRAAARGRGAGPRRTPLAIVYVHGWSAGVGEHKKKVEGLGKRLGANVVCWRLSGHGRVNNTPTAENEQMEHHATTPNLFADAVDALHVGLAVGERVVLVGSSTGAALLTVCAANGPWALRSRVAALVGLSPAYALATPLYPVLGPLLAGVRAAFPREMARTVGALLVQPFAGRMRSNMPPINDEHGRQWTLRYSTKAMLTSVEAIWAAGTHLDFGDLRCPCMFVGNDRDHVVDWSYTIGPRVYGRIRGVPRVALTVEPGDDDHGHVLGSSVISEGTVPEVTAAVATFLETYAVVDDA